MFQHTSRRAISLALLLVSSITFQSVAFTGVVRAQKLKPLRAPVAKPKTGGGAVPTPNAPNLAGATKVDSWDDSVIPNGKAEPGQTITYTVTITNSGPDPATGVSFTDTIDPN